MAQSVSDEHWIKRATAGQLKALQEELIDLWQQAETIQVPLAFDHRQRTRWASQDVSRAMGLMEKAHDHIEALLQDEAAWVGPPDKGA